MTRPAPGWPSLPADRGRRRLTQALLTGGACATLGMPAFLAGCASGAEPLTVAYHPWPGYAPLELARHMGWWGPHARGLNTVSASQSFEALRTGQVQAAAMTLDEALMAQSRGVPVSVVALFDLSAGADMVLSRQRLERGAITRDLRVGHEAGMVGELMTASWLETQGLRYGDVQAVHLSPNEHEVAWRLGQVDVLVTYEPVAGRLIAQGAQRVFDSSMLPPERPIADVLVVRQDRLSAHGSALAVLVPTIFAGQRHVRELPTDASHRLSRWLDLPVAQVLDSFRGLRLTDWSDNRAWLTGSAPRLLPAVEHLLAFMRDHHQELRDGLTRGPGLEPGFLPLEAPL